MSIKQKLETLATERNAPCVTISFNTHRTRPDNEKDKIVLKNLVKEAETRVIEKFGKRPVQALLDKLSSVTEQIDVSYNLDSLHLFLSNDTLEIVRSIWSTNENIVHVSDAFVIRPLIKSYSRTEEYYILLLSQGGVHLYHAMNDSIVKEIINTDFPFTENPIMLTDPVQASDAKRVDNKAREYFNNIDKALVKLYRDSTIKTVVVTTENNYSLLQQVADFPSVYLGNITLDFNNSAPHQLVDQGWKFIQSLQQERQKEAIAEMKNAVSDGIVVTDLQEIYQAALDGRGELLIVNQHFSQPVVLENRTLKVVESGEGKDVIDDVASTISWEVVSKKGRVVYTEQEHLSDLGNIALKTRY
ncbi:MAG: hypothetical protein KF704_07165 [Crocinitomicaceae bacterium]|nr:hypothetical protein [Crocinitomicaceae bacterium]NGF76029.1 hypothetical protein [Fluviicola sp. SGL-29]